MQNHKYNTINFKHVRIYFILDSHNLCLFWIEKLCKSWTCLFKIEYFPILNADYTCADAEHTSVEIEHMCTNFITHAPVHINDFRGVRARYVKRTG